MDLGPHGEQIAQSDVVSEKCLTKRLLKGQRETWEVTGTVWPPGPVTVAEPRSAGNKAPKEGVAAGTCRKRTTRRWGSCRGAALQGRDRTRPWLPSAPLRGAGEINALPLSSALRPPWLVTLRTVPSGSHPHGCQGH